MSFIYHDPHTVLNPRKFIRKIEVLYDGEEDGFSMALIDWEGLDHIGIRWNVAAKEQNDPEKQAGRQKCDGSPSTAGIPSWFILPRELFDPERVNQNRNEFSPADVLDLQILTRSTQ